MNENVRVSSLLIHHVKSSLRVKVEFIMNNEPSSGLYTLELYLSTVDDSSTSHFLLIKLLITTFIISFNCNIMTLLIMLLIIFINMHFITYNMYHRSRSLHPPTRLLIIEKNQTMTGLIMIISSTTNSSSDSPSLVGRLSGTCFPAAIRLGASRASMASSG